MVEVDDRAYALRSPPEIRKDTDREALVEGHSEAQTLEEEVYILCRQCLQIISSPQEQIAVDGAHRHTFANPHGIVFEIGCFRTVIGCGYVGSASDEFSWFRGFSWQVAVCGMCLNHLGWRFTSTAAASFHGLILDRLVTRSLAGQRPG